MYSQQSQNRSREAVSIGKSLMKIARSPKQRNLRKGRVSEPGRAYSITKCTNNGVNIVIDPVIPELIINCFFWMAKQKRFNLGAFIVMPDHYHLIIQIDEEADLSEIMKTIGSFTSREINRITGKKGQVWQKGYYDRAILRSEDIQTIIEYIHYNPVRKGLVNEAESWIYSSLNPIYYQRISWGDFA